MSAPFFPLVLAALAGRVVGNSLARVPRRPPPSAERALRTDPVPIGGGAGIALVAVALLALAHNSSQPLQGTSFLLAAMALLAGVSWWDDMCGLPVLPRLLTHTLVALLLVPAGLVPDPLPLLLFLLVAVWSLNLFNFMDNLDGLVAGVSSVGFGVLSLLAYFEGAHALAFGAGALAMATVGFLTLNLPPATVFLGDVGAMTLGYCALVLSLLGIQAGVFHVWEPLLLFSPLIFDATATLVARTALGFSPWRAHCGHLDQRLAKLGMPVPAVTLLYVVATACSALLVLLLRWQPSLASAALIAWFVLFLLGWHIVRSVETSRARPRG